MNENELTVIVEQNNLSEDFASKLQTSFTPLFDQARSIADEAKAIVVSDENQKDLMAQARSMRLKIKAIRVDAENKRKELKEESLRTGKAVDGMANIIKFLIVPVEEHLQLQEDFAKLQEEKRKQELGEKRKAELAEFGLENPEYDLANMSDEGYKMLLENARLAHEHRAEDARKAEEARVKAEEDRLAEEKRVREENEKLKREAAEREKNFKIEQERKAEQNKKLQDNLKKEREKREKVEAEIKAKKEAERKALEEKQKKEKDEELARLKAEKEARLAPDKEKMRGIYANLSKAIRDIQMTSFETAEARSIAGDTIESLQNTQTNIMERMKKISE